MQSGELGDLIARAKALTSEDFVAPSCVCMGLSLLANICSLSTSAESNFSKREWVLASCLGLSVSFSPSPSPSSEMSSARKSLALLPFLCSTV